MRTARWLTAIVVLVGMLLATRFASPSTPTLMNELPLGRCYSRCAASILLNFDWCAGACWHVLGGGGVR